MIADAEAKGDITPGQVSLFFFFFFFSFHEEAFRVGYAHGKMVVTSWQ